MDCVLVTLNVSSSSSSTIQKNLDWIVFGWLFIYLFFSLVTYIYGKNKLKGLVFGVVIRRRPANQRSGIRIIGTYLIQGSLSKCDLITLATTGMILIEVDTVI